MDKFLLNSNYRIIFEATSSALIIVEADTTIKYANQYFCRLVGLKQDQIESKLSWTEFVPADDKKRLMKYHVWRRSKNHRAPDSYEFTLVDHHQHIRHCLARVNMIAQTDLSIVSIMDITDRIRSENLLKQSQEQFKTVFNQAPVAFILVNRDSRIIKLNKTAAKIFSLSPQVHLGHHLSSLIKKHYLPTEINLLCAPHQNHSLDEVKFVTRSGKSIFLKIIASKINLPNQPSQWLLMFEDISSSVEAKAIISNLPSRILEAHEEEKLLLSREIHDTLSQSLAALKMAIQTGYDNDGLVPRVNQLIEVSRTLSQNLRPETIENLGLIPALEQLAKSIRQRFSSKICIVTNQQHLQLEAEVSLQLYRITQEAILNAARHGQAKNIIVALTQRSHQLKLVISDDGKGFDPSQTAVSAKKSDSLGLKIMLERAKRIHAKFILRSKVGSGTKVIINCQLNQPQEKL